MIPWLLLACLHNPEVTCTVKCDCPELPVCERCWWPHSVIEDRLTNPLRLTATPVDEPVPTLDLRAFAELQNAFGTQEDWGVRKWEYNSTEPVFGPPGFPTTGIFVIDFNYQDWDKPRRWQDMNDDWIVDLTDFDMFQRAWMTGGPIGG